MFFFPQFQDSDGIAAHGARQANIEKKTNTLEPHAKTQRQGIANRLHNKTRSLTGKSLCQHGKPKAVTMTDQAGKLCWLSSRLSKPWSIMTPIRIAESESLRRKKSVLRMI